MSGNAKRALEELLRERLRRYKSMDGELAGQLAGYVASTVGAEELRDLARALGGDRAIFMEGRYVHEIVREVVGSPPDNALRAYAQVLRTCADCVDPDHELTWREAYGPQIGDDLPEDYPEEVHGSDEERELR